MVPPGPRIPTLDGWRGVAVILVLSAHAQAGLWRHTWRYLPWLDTGKHGVTIFFVLSGYLITTLLRREGERVSLRQFYLRRFLRLMPVALAYLVAVWLLGSLVHQKTIGSDALACLTFVRNYIPFETPTNAMTSHFWSLSIEEQFYLAWPLTLVLLRRRAMLVAVAGALGVAAYRWLHWTLEPSTRSELRMDALLIGCVLALALEYDWLRQAMTRYAAPLAAGAAAVPLWEMAHYTDLLPMTESVAIAVLLGATSLRPEMALGRVLELGPLRGLGVVSYSVYVWQELFLIPHWGPMGWVPLPLVVYVSYAWIERPFRKLGRGSAVGTGVSADRPPVYVLRGHEEQKLREADSLPE